MKRAIAKYEPAKRKHRTQRSMTTRGCLTPGILDIPGQRPEVSGRQILLVHYRLATVARAV
eukprot:6911857-Alexandrium_andersonii.AAC.1